MTDIWRDSRPTLDFVVRATIPAQKRAVEILAARVYLPQQVSPALRFYFSRSEFRWGFAVLL